MIFFSLDTAGYVKVWHYSTQQCVYTFDEKDRQPLALDFNASHTRLYVAGKKTNNPSKLNMHFARINHLGSDCKINCYDFTTKKLISTLRAS